MALLRKHYPSRTRLCIGLATVCAVLPAAAATAGISPWAGLSAPEPQGAATEFLIAAPAGLHGSYAAGSGWARGDAVAALYGRDDDGDDDDDDDDRYDDDHDDDDDGDDDD